MGDRDDWDDSRAEHATLLEEHRAATAAQQNGRASGLSFPRTPTRGAAGRQTDTTPGRAWIGSSQFESVNASRHRHTATEVHMTRKPNAFWGWVGLTAALILGLERTERILTRLGRRP